MVSLSHARIYQRFPFYAPLIIGGEAFVNEGILRNLSMHGCSIVCDRELPLASTVRVSVLLPDQVSALSIELGRIIWVHGNECGIEFVQLPLQSRMRLNRTLRIELIQFLNARKSKNRELETRPA